MLRTIAPARVRLLAALTAALLVAALAGAGAAEELSSPFGSEAEAGGSACVIAVPEAEADTDAEADGDTDEEPVLCESQVFFKPADTKVGNLAGQGLDGTPTWDDQAPTDSVATGAGGGYATFRAGELFDVPGDPTYKPTFQGTFTGPLDTLAVDLYLFSPVYQRTGTEFPLLVSVKIDGKIIAFHDSEEIDTPIQPGGDAAALIRFALTDLYEVMERRGLDLSHDAEHTMEISATARYFGDGNSVFVYDTTEVPSGMTFNATDLEGYTLVP
jgi:hypothetical protein